MLAVHSLSTDTDSSKSVTGEVCARNARREGEEEEEVEMVNKANVPSDLR